MMDLKLDSVMSTVATSLISLVIWFLKSYVADQKEWEKNIQRQITDVKGDIVDIKDRLREMETNIKVHVSTESKRNYNQGIETQKDVNSIIEYLIAQVESRQSGFSEEKPIDHCRVLVLEKKVDAIINALTKTQKKN